MSYINQLNAFHDLVEIKQLSTGQIALWYALMHINNKCAWQEWFTVPNKVLSSHSGLSRQGVMKARNALKQAGFIDFRANGTKATFYKMMDIAKSVQSSCQDGIQASIQDGIQASIQEQPSCTPLKQESVQVSCTLNRLDKTRQDIAATTASNIYTYYEQLFGPVTQTAASEIGAFLDDGFSGEVLCRAIDKACGERKGWSYAKGVLRNYAASGAYTLEAAKALDAERLNPVSSPGGAEDDDARFNRIFEKLTQKGGGRT